MGGGGSEGARDRGSSALPSLRRSEGGADYARRSETRWRRRRAAKRGLRSRQRQRSGVANRVSECACAASLPLVATPPGQREGVREKERGLWFGQRLESEAKGEGGGAPCLQPGFLILFISIKLSLPFHLSLKIVKQELARKRRDFFFK
jgi:hypothetical protein